MAGSLLVQLDGATTNKYREMKIFKRETLSRGGEGEVDRSLDGELTRIRRVVS